jgi:hypothetical protein
MVYSIQASLVQLVERRSPKPDVVGSSPTGRETQNKASMAVASQRFSKQVLIFVNATVWCSNKKYKPNLTRLLEENLKRDSSYTLKTRALR